MRRLPLLLAFSLAIGMLPAANAAPSPADAATRACARVGAVYNACGTRFRFDGSVFRFPNGESMLCSDGRHLDFYDRQDDMDVASIYRPPYRTGETPLPETRRNWDPGRLRPEPLLKAVYGGSEGAVRAQLVAVSFLGQTVKFQRRLGAASALRRVSDELLGASSRDPELARFLAPFTTGRVDLRQFTFYWRAVRGTTRLSTHSFGTGIDLRTYDGPEYWLWDEARRDPDKAARGEDAYRFDHFVPEAAPRMNARVIRAFERQSFIWGGKWNHYDAMHFEYRPELFATVMPDCAGEAQAISEIESSSELPADSLDH